MAVTDGESQQHEDSDGSELGESGGVDQRRAALHSKNVDGGQQDDGADGDNVPAR